MSLATLRYGMSMFYSLDHRLTTHPQVYRSHSNVSLSYSFEISCTIEFQATYASLARMQAVISFSGSISERITDFYLVSGCTMEALEFRVIA